jgi:hypothetical protein
MKIPDRKSRTRLWAPNPSATPATPALARIGPRSTPSSASTVKKASPKMTIEAMLFSTAPIVSARSRRRSATRAPDASTSTVPRRFSASRSCSLESLAFFTTRVMARETSQRITTAPRRMAMMRRGVPTR